MEVRIMANSNSTELVAAATRSVSDAVSSLHTLWTIVEKSLDNGTDWATCEMIHELLPLIGGKLDAALGAMGGSPCGSFDDVLDKRGIRITAPSALRTAAFEQ
ncbi:hypothetical protein WS94_01300 [Burkholderia territorii]|nr:hypothetical protein WS94_01300 [Burkholderia territorii]